MNIWLLAGWLALAWCVMPENSQQSQHNWTEQNSVRASVIPGKVQSGRKNQNKNKKMTMTTTTTSTTRTRNKLKKYIYSLDNELQSRTSSYKMFQHESYFFISFSKDSFLYYLIYKYIMFSK